MSEEIKYIFECLKKYANLTPDAIDDLYYLEGYIKDLQQKVDRLNKIINYIWKVFENGSFEDGCDCIKIYDYLKALKEDK